MKQIFEILFSVLLKGVLAYIAAVDIQKKQITNRSLIILGVVGIAATYPLPLSLLERIAASIVTAMPLLGINLVRSGAFGGGDVKLLAIAGFLLGIRGGILALCAAFLSGGVVSVLLLVTGKKRRTDSMAFGPYICFGICIFFVNSSGMP